MLEENKQAEETYIYKTYGIKLSRYNMLPYSIFITGRKKREDSTFCKLNSWVKKSKGIESLQKTEIFQSLYLANLMV